MNVYKEIAYSFPTSTNAEILGFRDSGCWHVSITYANIEGSGQCKTFLPHDAEGFAEKDDPDLLAVFAEYEGGQPDWVKS
jgi:hypothetical protein